MTKRIGFGKSVRRLFYFLKGKKSGTACKPLGLGANIFFGLIHISSFSSRCFFVQNFLLPTSASFGICWINSPILFLCNRQHSQPLQCPKAGAAP